MASPTAATAPPLTTEVLRLIGSIASRATTVFAIATDASLTPGQFDAVDMRVGRIVSVESFPEARVPAWKLRIDFGPELGIRLSSARVTNYARDELEGTLVVGVVNFTPKQIGPVRSEVLVLGAVDHEGTVHLLRPDGDPPLGSRIA